MDIKNKRLDNNSTGEKYFVLLFVRLCSCSFVFYFFEQEHKGTNDWTGVQEMMLCAFVRALVLLFSTETKS